MRLFVVSLTVTALVGLGCRDPEKELAPYRSKLETQARVCAGYEEQMRVHADYAEPARSRALLEDSRKVLACDLELGGPKHEYMKACTPALGRNACERRVLQVVETARPRKN